MRFSPILLLMFFAAGCSEPADPPVPAEPIAFAILADPHIAGRAESERRLAICVDWINAKRSAGPIEVVFVLGDIGWGEGNLARAKAILDRLEVPYVPLLGDNEVATGYEGEFEVVFGPHYEGLSEILSGFVRAPTPVRDPVTGKSNHLQNFSFDLKGLHFVGLDWTTRRGGESADLHDYPGGTLPFLGADLARAKSARECIVLLSHLPMHRNIVHEVFTAEEDARLEDLVGRHREHVHANYAGHYHMSWNERRTRGGYLLHVCDATWDDEATVTVVSARREGDAFTYSRVAVAVR